jgi:hypothetical protein
MKNSASQPAIAVKADGVASLTSHALLPPLVDELMDLYVSWLEECAAVTASYENWRASERRDNPLAFSAYLAALDREEHAASAYQGLVERIAEVHRGSSALAPQPAPEKRSDSASGTRWGFRHMARKLRPTRLVEQRVSQL